MKGIRSFRSFPKKRALRTLEFNQRNYDEWLLGQFNEESFETIRSDQNWRIFDRHNDLLLQFFRHESPETTIITRKFTTFMDSLNPKLFSTKKSVTRFSYGQEAAHFGFHFYNPRHDEKCGREYGKTYVVEYKELKQDLPKLYNEDMNAVFDFISSAFKLQNPLDFAEMQNYATYGGRVDNRNFFQAGALNKHPLYTRIHSDNDAGISILFWGGNFEGGGLVLPQLGLILQVRPGDILCLNAKLLHYVKVDDVVGIRHSMSLYSKEFVHRDFEINFT